MGTGIEGGADAIDDLIVVSHFIPSLVRGAED